MKTLKLIVVLLTVTSFAFAQNFEGKIVYKNQYKSKIPNVSDEQFTAMLGNTQEYFIKGGNYKATTNGTYFESQLYINKDNKIYNKMANNPVLLWNDCSVNDDEITKAEINKGVIEILGYTCDELVLTCKSGVQKFYFNSKLKVDARLYEKHKFGNWNEVMFKIGAVPLKMIIDNPQFGLEAVASEVVPMKLEDKLFELPADAKTAKSPY